MRGCWDFVGRITVSDRTVTWDQFEQVHRDWDDAALGAFVFDHRRYEAERRFPAVVEWPADLVMIRVERTGSPDIKIVAAGPDSIAK